MNRVIRNNTFKKTWAWLLVTIMVVTLAIPTCIKAIAGDASVTITESAGCLESAYVKWAPVTNATAYHVYYKSATAADTTYTMLDDMLIRQYDSYFRADAAGLKAGDYVIKVVPVFGQSENADKAKVSSTLTVLANTREGFAFSAQSKAKTGSGGYNDDGTAASNAQIVYVSEANKNTVTASVITSSNGSTSVCTGIGAILSARSKGYDSRPLIIRVIGKVTMFANSANTNYMQLKGTQNLTVEGIGEDATLYGLGVLIRECTNVEVRNIGVMMFPDDGISLDTNNNNIWIHNNDIFYGAPGSDADQVKGDGSCDIKAYSNYITVSYNHFWDSGKCSLCGMSDTQEFFVTYHHNWFDHSDSRQPRVRVGTIHVYNNYFDGNSKYGVGVTKGSSVFVENNYFRNCKYPMLSSLQGSDIYGNAVGTFSGEAGGMIKAYGNTIIGATRFVDQTYSATDFDAITTTSRNATVPDTYKTVSGGTTYNNFDTASTMYTYSVDTSDNAKVKVQTYAGRINGGDFKWSFNDQVDDDAHTVNTALKSAIVGYTSKLVSVGGKVVNGEAQTSQATTVAETTATGTTAAVTTAAATTATGTTATATTAAATTAAATTAATTTAAATQPASQSTAAGVQIHNFTQDGLNSSFYTFTSCNLSKDKGTVTYNGLSLTQCLKMETSTKVTFTAAEKGKLTLVFLSATANVKVNETKLTATDGTITVDVPAGSNSITKADSNNLYYIIFTPEGGQTPTQATTAPTQATTAPTQATTEAPTQATTQAPTQATTEATTAAGNNGTYSQAEVVNGNSVVASDKVAEEIMNSTATAATVVTNNAPQLDSTVFNSIMGKDKEVSVKVVNTDNQLLYSWTFSGNKISNANIPLDLTISFNTDKQQAIETLTGQTNALYISFSQHGELPGPATIKTYVGDKYKNGEVLYLYYYNEESKKIELISDKGLTVNDGYVEYTITHCSVYFLSQNEQLSQDSVTTVQNSEGTTVAQNPDSTAATVKTSDNRGIVIYMVAILLAGSVFTVAYISKKRRV